MTVFFSLSICVFVRRFEWCRQQSPKLTMQSKRIQINARFELYFFVVLIEVKSHCIYICCRSSNPSLCAIKSKHSCFSQQSLWFDCSKYLRKNKIFPFKQHTRLALTLSGLISFWLCCLIFIYSLWSDGNANGRNRRLSISVTLGVPCASIQVGVLSKTNVAMLVVHQLYRIQQITASHAAEYFPSRFLLCTVACLAFCVL